MINQRSDTKEKLLDAAQDLIQRRGVNAVSFQDLSDAVGIRKASVHHHFSNKQAMVEALLERYVDQFNGLLQQILASRTNGKTKLRRYTKLFVDTLKSGNNKVCLCGMLMAEVISLGDRSQDLVRSFLKSNTDALEAILREGVDDGSLTLNASIKGTARLILATLEGGLLIARCDGGAEQLADTSSKLIQLLVR